MGKKLSHLPTKPTPVKPESGKPFIRNQHVNPDKDAPKSESPSKKQQDDSIKNKKSVKDQPIKNDKIKKKLETVRTKIDDPLDAKQKDLEKGIVKHTNKWFNDVEEDYFSRIPEHVRPSQLEMIWGGNANAVYTYAKGTDSESFYKPRHGEDHELREGLITDNFAGREVLAYELSKMLGAEDLMPPTKLWKPDFEGSGKKRETEGSMQMSIYNFGKKMGLKNVETAFVKANSEDGYKKQMDKIENAGDLVAFDFIINNTDRHGFNFYVGEKENGNLQAIAYDHGSAFPERDSNEFFLEDGLTKDTQRGICRSAQASTSISTKFMIGILEFKEGDFDKLRKAYELPDEAANGVVKRIKALQEHVKEKFAKAQQTWKPEEFDNMDAYKAYMKKQGTLTAYDVSEVAERKFGAIFG